MTMLAAGAALACSSHWRTAMSFAMRAVELNGTLSSAARGAESSRGALLSAKELSGDVFSTALPFAREVPLPVEEAAPPKTLPSWSASESSVPVPISLADLWLASPTLAVACTPIDISTSTDALISASEQIL